MKNKRTVDLLCRFEGTKCGEVGWPPGKTKEEVLAQFSDIRCDACNIQYGRYKDMEKEYTSVVNRTGEGFDDYIKDAEYKRGAFDKKIQKIMDEKEKLKKVREKQRLEKLKKLNIEEV